MVQDAAQSFHLNKRSATIHPLVYNYNIKTILLQANEIRHGNYLITSECNTHDTIAVHLFLKLLPQNLKEYLEILGILSISQTAVQACTKIGRIF